MSEIKIGDEVMVAMWTRTRPPRGERSERKRTKHRYRATVVDVHTCMGAPGVVLHESTFHRGGGTKWVDLDDVELASVGTGTREALEYHWRPTVEEI